jgi:hypothetical protein
MCRRSHRKSWLLVTVLAAASLRIRDHRLDIQLRRAGAGRSHETAFFANDRHVDAVAVRRLAAKHLAAGAVEAEASIVLNQSDGKDESQHSAVGVPSLPLRRKSGHARRRRCAAAIGVER